MTVGALAIPWRGRIDPLKTSSIRQWPVLELLPTCHQ